jgi:transcriptional antiterminator NusG
MNNWCVLFVKTGMEEKIIEKLKSVLDLSLISVFIITKEKYFRKSECGFIRKNICFPGYIFIETNLLVEELLRLKQEVVKHIKGIYRFLSYTDIKDIFIRKSELSTLKMLCDETVCIRNSTGIIVGDKILIKSGPLIGMESVIKKIDRHGRNATIELNLLGAIRNITVGLEIVTKMIV